MNRLGGSNPTILRNPHPIHLKILGILIQTIAQTSKLIYTNITVWLCALINFFACKVKIFTLKPLSHGVPHFPGCSLHRGNHWICHYEQQAMFVIYNQIQLVKGRDIGYAQENLITVPLESRELVAA